MHIALLLLYNLSILFLEMINPVIFSRKDDDDTATTGVMTLEPRCVF